MLNLVVFLSILHLLGATDTPIIGILSQPSDYYDYDTFIGASYVKFLEVAGARVLPIWINQTTDYYERVVNYTNGVLFPGGSSSFTTPGGYGDTASIIYKLAQKSNDAGNFYPVWGTCLGFEVIPFIETGINMLVECSVDHDVFPVIFEENFRESRLFGNASDHLIHILSTKNVTYNYHEWCYTQEDFEKNGVDNWITLTTNIDNNGLKFISTMENTKYPFYGVQYHPEKNGFEFTPGYKSAHDVNGIEVMQYFANFFVEETRKNTNQFPSRSLELTSLIYNYCTKFSGEDDEYYYQMYGFYQNDYQNQLID